MPTKILAIDDSKTMRLAIKITFAAEDAKVTAVSKGSEAVARARQMQADVVLVDHNLAPGEPSGFEVVQALKANPATASIPVIMLVPARGGVSEADISAAGADNYIGKPFDSQVLIDKVAAALGRGASKPSPAVARPPAARVPAVAAPPAARAPVAAPPPAARAPAARPPVAAPRPAAPPVAAPPVRAARPPAAVAAAAQPAARPASARPARAPSPAAAPAAAVASGTIPIAIPIPFTAASSPTPGMLERIKAAAGTNGAAAGLDPAAIRALIEISHELIEQIVWEVVPELAEELIKKKLN